MTKQVPPVDRIRITVALRELTEIQPWGDARHREGCSTTE
jgi:hypothetical protein